MELSNVISQAADSSTVIEQKILTFSRITNPFFLSRTVLTRSHKQQHVAIFFSKVKNGICQPLVIRVHSGGFRRRRRYKSRKSFIRQLHQFVSVAH